MTRPGAVAVTVVLAVGAYAWWAVDRAPFSNGATVAVVGAGLVAMTVGARERRTRPVEASDWQDRPVADTGTGAGPVRGVVLWAGLAVAAAAWQLASYLQAPRDEHPTLSSITNGLLDSHPARALAFGLWLFAARGLARR